MTHLYQPPMQESRRLSRLKALGILDTAAEPIFDSLARAASAICGTPIALISLVDEERQWFKANVGLEGTLETARNISFCAHAIEGSDLFEVADASHDKRFAANPLVTGEAGIRFYAGAPLVMPTGERLGTLCVIDRHPHSLTESQKTALRELAATAVQAMELREQAHHIVVTSSDRKFEVLADACPFGIFHTDAAGQCTYTNPRWQEIYGLSLKESLGEGWSKALHPDDREAVYAEWQRCAEMGREFDKEFRISRPNGDVIYVRATARSHANSFGKVSGYVGAIQDITESRAAVEQLREVNAFLDRAERIAGVGGWELDFNAGLLRWTDQTCRIYDLKPGHQPALDEHLKYFSSDAQHAIEQTALECVESGKSWDLELPMVTAKGRRVWIRSVGKVLKAVEGKPTHLVGALQDITDKKATEDKLRRANDLLATMLENLPCGVSVFDADLKLVNHNRNFRRMLGFPDSLFSTPVTHFESLIRYNAEQGEYGEGNREEKVAQIVSRALEPSLHRFERTRPNGITLEIQGAPMPGGGFVTTYTDISERRRSEAALRVSEERQQRALDASGLALWDYDLDTDRVYLSEAWSDMLGGPRIATITTGQALVAQVPRQDHAAVLDAVRPLLKGEANAYAVEHRVIRQDGTLMWVQSEGRVAERDAEGRVHRIVGTNRNITEIRRGQDELKRISSLLLSVLDAATEVAVVCVDTDGRVTVFNKGAERMLGYSADEVVGSLSPVLFLDPLEVAARLQETGEKLDPSITLLDALTHQSIHGKAREWTYIRKDGGRLPVSLVITEVRSFTGELLGRLSTAHDITRQKEQERSLQAAKEAAEQAAQAKAAFLANMSHEIRTPMNGVIGMTSLLLDTELSKEQREFTEIIRRSGEGLLVVINDILDYSKIEAGQMEFEWQPFDLREAIESSIELLAQKAQEKKLDLLYLIEPEVPQWIFGDFARLRQVLVNLISNALKFTEQGDVVLSVRRCAAALMSMEDGREDEPVFLEFCVRDTGIGIPADKLPRLFQAFSQADSSTSRKYGGTGLGLVISRRLVEAMKGRMWAHSEESSGTSFFFSLETARASAIAEPHPLDFSQFAGKKILLVDDNAANLRILSTQTECWGMQPRSCSSALEALAILETGANFDVLVADLHMPGMDGVALCRSVRAVRSSLPLILLSSSNSRQFDETGLFSAVLTKPAREVTLFQALSHAIHGAMPAAIVRPTAPSQFDSTISQRFPLRILLAEDNEINRLVALRVLRGFGYQADVAANGLEAVEAVRRQPYDLVLMDIQMPEMDGMEATRRIVRGRPLNGRPRIVGMSANALREDTEAALQAGMDDYIVKPFAIADLRAKLTQIGETMTVRSSPAHRSKSPMREAALERHDLLDLDQVRSLVALDPSGVLAAQLTTSFAPKTEHLLEKLRLAVAERDLDSASHSAHQLKGSVGTLGMFALAQIAAEMESCLRSQDWAKLPDLIALATRSSDASVRELKIAFSTAMDELSQYRAEDGG